MAWRRWIFVSTILVLGQVSAARAADEFRLDPMHTSVMFKISHLGLSWTYGRFNDVGGEFTIDAEQPANTSFALSIKSDSIDTNNAKRDGHLRTPDFFNTKQYPQITFKSTSVRAIEGGFEVKGDLTMHGATKSITFPLKGGRMAEFPKGMKRTGYTTELTVKRSDFGMDKMLDAIDDPVLIAISFEGVKK